MYPTRTTGLMIMLLAAGTLLGGSVASAQTAPYVASYETDNFFSTITANEMDVLRTKKILFISRSFGLNMRDGLARMAAIDPMYNILDSYVRYDIPNNTIGSIPGDAFSNYNFVHVLGTFWPYTQRLNEMDTLLRDAPYSFGPQVDVVMVYYHTADTTLVTPYTNMMAQWKTDFPNIKFVTVTSGYGDATLYATANANSTAFGDQMRAIYKDQEPLYDLGYILNNDGACGDGYCPEYSDDPAGVHPNSPAGEERMGKAFLLMLRDLYFGSSCTNMAPPSVVGSLSGTALSDSSISLSWTESTHECGIARYELTRNGAALASTHATNYTDTGLAENTAYDYAVRAVSMAEVASAYSSTTTVTTLSDTTPPTVVQVKGVSATELEVTFNEAMDQTSAETASNYTLDNGVTVLSAVLSSPTVVTLTTSGLSDGTTYTLTLNNVADASSGTNPIAPGTLAVFTYSNSTYPTDPIAYWKLDGTLNDSTTNGLNASWVGAASYGNALLGQGLALDGTTNGVYAQVANNALLGGMPELTISVWARKNHPDVAGTLFMKTGAYYLQVNNDTLKVNVQAGSSVVLQPTVADLNNTNWHHYAVVYDGANASVYIDGVARSTTALTGNILSPSIAMSIGKNTVNTPYYTFAGDIDEMKIFDRALNTNELSALVLNGIAGSADRAAVRTILDSNSLTNKQVDAISVYQDDRIVKLYLQEAGVSNLTSEIGQLSELTMLHLYGDRALGYPLLTDVAPELGNCTKLGELLLNQNDLADLPAAITNLTALNTCSIGENYLCNPAPVWETWADTFDPDWVSTQICGGAPTAFFSASPLSGTAPLVVTFSDTSTGTVTNRFWDFGDGATTNTTETTVLHTYTAGGTQTVQLIASGPDGASTNTQPDLISVAAIAAPSASFSADPTSGYSPLPVTFTDTSTGSITSRLWDFGDGGTTNTMATSVEHTYTTGGTFSVELIVVGPGGASTNTMVNLISATTAVAPTASFSATPLAGTAPLAVTFTDASTGDITSRLWDFGDGATTNTTATSVAHTYTAAGTNTVQLIVSGPGGSSTNTQANLISATVPVVTGGGVVNFDLSASYDYDAYATGEEIANNTNVDGTLGDHTLLKSVSGYVHLVDPAGAVYKGIPSTTINGGEFELAAGLTGDKFGTATGTTKVNNSVGRLSTDGSVLATRTATLMLEASQQAKYSDFNLLVNGNRYTANRSGVIMTALLEVKYVDDANWYTIWTESANITVGTTLGGVFGGSMVGPTATDSRQSSAWTEVLVNGDLANGYYKNTTPASGADYMYKLTTAAMLDDTQVLEGFRMTATTTDANRNNDFILYAASGTLAGAVPGGTDDDSDGLPNDWETQYFGGPTNANPAALAANGINTIMEAYIGGLNPTNAQSFFNLSGQMATAQTILQWDAVSGRVYSVYWATNLLNGFQAMETNLLYPQNSWTDLVHGAENEGFYKIKVQLGQ